MKKIFALTITLFLIFSLCSCDLLCACEKDIKFPEENYNAPEQNSIVTYEFDNGYKLTLLYTSSSDAGYTSEYFPLYGELQKENETMRVCVDENPRIDTCWQHGINIVGFDLIMFEIEGVMISGENAYPSMVYPDGFAANYGTRLAAFDAGILNSTKLTFHPSEDAWNITNISVEKSPISYWDWNDPTWSEFYTYGEDTHYISNDIGLSYHSWRNMGEMQIGGEKRPIKLVFHEEAMTISIYDMSNNGSVFIMGFTGHMDKDDADKFIVDTVECAWKFQYADNFSNLSGMQIIKTELTDN